MSRAAKGPLWTIDVCLTCGQQAKWPFCAHKPDHRSVQATSSAITFASWCVPVVVKPAYPAEFKRLMGPPR
jgi:hypothetical protein